MPDESTLSVAPPVDHLTASVAGPAATTGFSPDTAAIAAPPASPERYLLKEEIARGGMGAVYRATDAAFGREVAVKVLLDRFAPSSGTARRFRDEARITGQLQHPGIPPVFDLGTLPDGRPFLAMKLIKGETLDVLLTRQPDRGRLVPTFEAVCEAVAYAHAHGVVHRDLKPQNIMVGAFGEVQVMDWGLAKVLAGRAGDGLGSDDPDATAAAGTEVKSLRDSEDLLTQAGSVLGTPAYMAPEQAIGAVHEIDARSDVFGLGAILAVVLSGRPPFVGNTAEVTRVLAARGEVTDCFIRLDESGADPQLVALCKRCLSPKREDRPADASEVARAVAALRQAADDRARQAELDKVKAEGETAAAAAAGAERRRRRRVWLAAAAALVLTAVGGLGAVLGVQRKANAELNAKNAALTAEQAKVERRFEMAKRAVAAFHTTIDEQPELGNEAFRPLRRKLLTAAAGFYRELEGMLSGESDPKSRAALADGYFQLAELTVKIGDQTEALAAYRKALAIRREMAAVPGADVPTRLAVSDTLRQVGREMARAGDTAGARQALEEARDVAAALEAEAPTDAVRHALAGSHHSYGWLLEPLDQTAEALEAYQRALAIRQALADAHPDDPLYWTELASTQNNIGLVLRDMGKPAESLAAHQKALAVRQRLVDANPEVPRYQHALAGSHTNIGNLLRRMGRPTDSLAALQKALGIYQELADAHPAVTEYQSDVAMSHYNIGTVLGNTGRSAESLAAHHKALAARQRLADAHPAVTEYQSVLADSHHSTGIALDRAGRTDEALAAFEKSRDLRQRLVDAQPTVFEYQTDLISSHTSICVVLDRTGRRAAALAAHQKALAARQKLADAQPMVPRNQVDLAIAHTRLGQLLAREGRIAEALAALDAGLAIREKLVAAAPTSTKYTNDLGYSHTHRGWVRVRAGQSKDAAADLRKAVELWAKASATGAEDRFEKARALALLAKLGADPKSGVSADEAKTSADRAVTALTDAVKAGWAEPAELKEPDFDAVRSREEFKKVQAEVEETVAARNRVAPPPREKW